MHITSVGSPTVFVKYSPIGAGSTAFFRPPGALLTHNHGESYMIDSSRAEYRRKPGCICKGGQNRQLFAFVCSCPSPIFSVHLSIPGFY